MIIEISMIPTIDYQTMIDLHCISLERKPYRPGTRTNSSLYDPLLIYYLPLPSSFPRFPSSLFPCPAPPSYSPLQFLFVIIVTWKI